jgi:oligoendopeptidase F
LPSLETIKILGIDLTKQTTYDQVYQIVERWIELFKHS